MQIQGLAKRNFKGIGARRHIAYVDSYDQFSLYFASSSLHPWEIIPCIIRLDLGRSAIHRIFLSAASVLATRYVMISFLTKSPCDNSTKFIGKVPNVMYSAFLD